MTRPKALRRAWRDLASGLWPGETDHTASLEAIRAKAERWLFLCGVQGESFPLVAGGSREGRKKPLLGFFGWMSKGALTIVSDSLKGRLRSPPKSVWTYVPVGY